MLQVHGESRGGDDPLTPPSCCNRKCWDSERGHRNRRKRFTFTPASRRQLKALHHELARFFLPPLVLIRAEVRISGEMTPWLCSNTTIFNSQKRMKKCNSSRLLKNQPAFSAFPLSVSRGASASASASLYSHLKRISVNAKVNYLQPRIPKQALPKRFR